MDHLDQLFAELRQVLSIHHPGFVGLEIVVLGVGVRKTVRWSIPETVQAKKKQSNRHSADFRSCTWNGEPYTFSPLQAAVIKQLWEAWENGIPGIGQASLLDEAGSEGKSLRDVFKEHLAMGEMIVGAGKGMFKLADGE